MQVRDLHAVVQGVVLEEPGAAAAEDAAAVELPRLRRDGDADGPLGGQRLIADTESDKSKATRVTSDKLRVTSYKLSGGVVVASAVSSAEASLTGSLV